MIYVCVLMVINLILIVKYVEEMNHFKAINLEYYLIGGYCIKMFRILSAQYILKRMITIRLVFYRVLEHFMCGKN